MAANLTKPCGRKPDKLWRDSLMRAVHRCIEGKGSAKRLDRLADALVKQAMAGDVRALKEIGDRLDGKPTQAIAGGEGEPLTVVIRRYGEG